MSVALNVYEAKSKFSTLLEKAENGEEITIARAGKPIAKIVPYKKNQVQINRDGMFGALKNQIILTEDWENWPDGYLSAMINKF